MAKKPEATTETLKTSQDVNAAAPAVEAPAVEAPIVEAPVESAALVPTEGVSAEYAARKALAMRLPEAARPRALALKRPTASQLMDIVMALPEAKQEAMLDLVAKTNPEKQGLHTASTGFAATSLKVYHGVGNDPTKPRQTLPGQFYSGDSRVLGEKINAVPLAIYEGQVLWPEKGAEQKAPICVSVDRVTGSKYGSCAACPLNPETRQYTQGGCMREITAYLLDDAFTSIYELKFSKTSEGAGRALVSVVKKANNIWDRWFSFDAKERVDKDRKWYVIQAGAMAVPGKPELTDTAKDLHPLFSALSKVVDADIYYPALANVHDRLKGSADAGGATAAPPFDEKGFLDSATSAAPDYSKDV